MMSHQITEQEYSCLGSAINLMTDFVGHIFSSGIHDHHITIIIIINRTHHTPSRHHIMSCLVEAMAEIVDEQVYGDITTITGGIENSFQVCDGDGYVIMMVMILCRV